MPTIFGFPGFLIRSKRHVNDPDKCYFLNIQTSITSLKLSQRNETTGGRSRLEKNLTQERSECRNRRSSFAV